MTTNTTTSIKNIASDPYIVRVILKNNRTRVQVYTYKEWRESTICRVVDRDIHVSVFNTKKDAMDYAHKVMGGIAVSNVSMYSAAVVGC